MNLSVIQQRLNQYDIKSQLDEENALKEITQEVILAALSRASFFNGAAFQGGSCLRIIYGLDRFSEDLDFILVEPDSNFQISSYLDHIVLELRAFGYHIEIQDRSKTNQAVQKVFLKDDSIGKQLYLNYPSKLKHPKKLKIKLEIDINPPYGSRFEEKYLGFPFPFPIYLQDKPSLFAGKLHAVLCREYVKGRDWYDLCFYLTNKTAINYEFLKNALNQVGPWKSQLDHIDKFWLIKELVTKSATIDWQKAIRDVAAFLKPSQYAFVEKWNADFFESLIYGSEV